MVSAEHGIGGRLHTVNATVTAILLGSAKCISNGVMGIVLADAPGNAVRLEFVTKMLYEVLPVPYTAHDSVQKVQRPEERHPVFHDSLWPENPTISFRPGSETE